MLDELVIGVSGLFLGALGVFALSVRGGALPADPRLDRRRSPIGGFLQHFMVWLIRPLERALTGLRVPPIAITAASVAAAGGTGALLSRGLFGLGGWLYVLTGVLDILDGRVARASGQVSAAGAFADSVADRAAEGAVLSGLAWYYRGSGALLLVLGALVASFLVSYARARGEGLGVACEDVGSLQRPERIACLSVALILTPPVELLLAPARSPLHPLALAGVGLLGAASLATAARRVTTVYRALSRRP